MGKRMNNGPDWTDVEMAMRALRSASGGEVSVLILPQGIGGTGGLRVALSWVPSLESVDGEDRMILSESEWPHNRNCTLAEHVYAGIASMDAQLALLEFMGQHPAG